MTDKCPDPHVSPSGAVRPTVTKTPMYKVRGDARTGWTPSDDAPAPLPPAAGAPPQPQQGMRQDDTGAHVFSFQQMSLLCAEIGLSPEMIDGIIAQLLVQHFSSSKNLIYDELSNYIWHPDPAQRKIFIMPLHNWNEINLGKLPAIVYANLGQQFERLAIGDADYAYKSLTDVAQAYAKLVHGSHRIGCVADNEYTASLLATELTHWLTVFSPRLVADLPFHHFHVMQREPPQEFQALGGKIGVAFVVQYAYTWTWELAPKGPPLKSLGHIPS